MTQVVGTLNPLWAAPYDDPDVASYGETPSALEWELRVAATPAGSGALVNKRTDVSQIVQSFRTGELLDSLTTTTGTSADANAAAATYSTTHPTGYSGNHLEVQATGGVSTTRGVRKACSAGAKDLSVYGGGTRIRVHRRYTSNTNLTRWALRFEFATVNDYAEYALAVAADAINTWAEVNVAKDNPTTTAGTVDWSLWSGNVRIVVIASGAYTGNCEVTDLRIGQTRTGKTVPDGDLAAESSYDSRVRYRDNATAKASTTTAAASAAGATNIKMTSVTNFAAGDYLTLATTGAVESRLIVTVGTAGGGGTGITVDEGFTYAHGSGDTAAAYYWGAWTPWLTIKASLPPVVVATTPTDASTVTSPTQVLSHTFTSSGGKAQASHTMRVYLRTTQDALIYEQTTEGTGLTDQVPRFLLDDGNVYAWEIEAADTDGLVGTSARFSFTADFTTPDAPEVSTTTVDTDASSVKMEWALVAGYDHFRVYWVAADGTWVRVDGGPSELDDGLEPLQAPVFTYYGARHGVNEFYVTASNGAVSDDESAADYVTATLGPIDDGINGLSSVVADGDPAFTRALRVRGPVRTRRSGVESLSPPGRGVPVHLNWSNGGKQISLTVRYRPAVDGDLVTMLETLQDDGTPAWWKMPAGYMWDPLRGLIVGLSDTAEDAGWVSVTVDVDETQD